MPSDDFPNLIVEGTAATELRGQIRQASESWPTPIRQRANQPAADLIGDLGGRGLGEFERLLAVGPQPESLVEGCDVALDTPSCGQDSKREFDPVIAVSIGAAVYYGKRPRTSCPLDRWREPAGLLRRTLS